MTLAALVRPVDARKRAEDRDLETEERDVGRMAETPRRLER